MDRPLTRFPALLLALAFTLTACGTAQQSATPSPTIESVAPTATADPTATPTRTPAPTPEPTPTPTPSLAERPFTVLVLGLDHEARTDVVMVVGIDPASKTANFASIPRDTVNVPLPGGGTFTNQKINSFYNYARSNPTRYPQGAPQATKDMVGLMLGIEIDYFASTTFGGFSALTEAMGGVNITLPKAVVDPYYQITMTNVGVSFPRGDQRLDGQRALIFVRTRQGDNDFERQRRQQAFLIAAGKQLLANPGLIGALLAAQGNLQTDFPLAEVPGLIGAIGSVDDWTINGAVLGPTRYESVASCPCGYALAPKLPEFRKLGRAYYPWAVTP
jgi:LCP family protein required for cell wall assembly